MFKTPTKTKRDNKKHSPANTHSLQNSHQLVATEKDIYDLISHYKSEATEFLNSNMYHEASEKFLHAIQTIQSIIQQRKVNLMSDWQILSDLQYCVANIYFKQNKDDQALAYYEKAITCLKQIPNKTPDDWDHLGNYFHSAALTLYKMKQNSAAIKYFLKAIESKNTIGENISAECIYDLVTYKKNLCDAYSHENLTNKKNFNSFEQAVIDYKNDLNRISNISKDDWGKLFKYLQQLGVLYYDKNLYNKLIDHCIATVAILNRIKNESSLEDIYYRYLALAHHNIFHVFYAMKSKSDALDHAGETIKNINNIPKKSLTNLDKYYLAAILFHAGKCLDSNQSRRYFLESLATCLTIDEKIPKTFNLIRLVYSQLKDSVLVNSIDWEFYDFACSIWENHVKEVFEDEDEVSEDEDEVSEDENEEELNNRLIVKFKIDKIDKLHHQILRLPTTSYSDLHTAYLQLLKLIHTEIANPAYHFPNKQVEQYFSDETHFAQLEKMIAEIETAHEPLLSLVGKIGNSSSFSVAVLNEINELKTQIDKLNNKINVLEAQNDKLRQNHSRFFAIKKSYSESDLTFEVNDTKSIKRNNI